MGPLRVMFERVGLQVDNKPILKGVSATLQAGRTAALIGPSGAGKSSLLSLCNLLVTPTEGQVFIGDQEVRAWNVRELRKKVGMVFQTPVLFPGSVEDNLAYGLQLAGLTLGRPAELLEDVGLSPDLLQTDASALSGGQKQRVALGRILAMEPQVLLLDEVTSALDVQARAEVEQTIIGLRQRTAATLLWVTHDLEQARRVSDEVWYVEAGEVKEQNSTERFFSGPQNETARAFLQQASGGGAE